MGSNFADFKLRQGISVLEKGREKHGSYNLSQLDKNKISLDEYNNNALNNSLTRMAESKYKGMGEKSFSLP